MAAKDYPTIEFVSVDDLCRLIADHTKGWSDRWYRGSKDPSYKLLPKLFRDKKIRAREGYISVEFRRRARSHLVGMNTGFDWLCALQHHGLPTRLLDWSESLAVALYFTVRPLGIDVVAPTLWVLNPQALYALTDGDGRILPISSSDDAEANADISFHDDQARFSKLRTALPIPVAPDFLFDRLSAQNGTFTIHGTDEKPLDELIPEDKRDLLLKFVAKSDKIKEIWRTLDFIIPSSDSIFPDIEGMKDYIV